MKVEILGPGCKNCKKLEENAQKAVHEIEGQKIKVRKIEDPAEIVSKGVMNTPALAVDGEVVFSGRVPSKNEIKEALE